MKHSIATYKEKLRRLKLWMFVNEKCVTVLTLLPLVALCVFCVYIMAINYESCDILVF